MPKETPCITWSWEATTTQYFFAIEIWMGDERVNKMVGKS